MTDAATVLIVDDEPLNVDLLEQELAEAGLRTLSAGSGEEALAVARRTPPDLILLDVMMRGIDGFETCRRLKNDASTRHIPVIFLTALKETFDKVQAFGCGAVDYVTKPFESEELLARVGVHLALRREVEAHSRSKATIRALVEDSVARSDAMIGRSAALARVREQIAQVAPTDSTVLVQGETGTGKELVARAIHAASARRDRALIRSTAPPCRASSSRASCSATRRARSPARSQQRRGRFELADGGTLFLDEIGELPLDDPGQAAARPAGARVRAGRRLAQPACRRARGRRHQPRSARRGATPGGSAPTCTTGSTCSRSRCRRCANAATTSPRCVEHFARATARRLGRPGNGLAASFASRAREYDWPGNIRELENLVERALIMSNGGPLDASDLLPARRAADRLFAGEGHVDNLDALESAHIRRVLESTGWTIEGERGAALALGLNPSTLRGRMRKLGLRKPR